MAKINSKALDPLRYSCIQAEQQELKEQGQSMRPCRRQIKRLFCAHSDPERDGMSVFFCLLPANVDCRGPPFLSFANFSK